MNNLVLRILLWLIGVPLLFAIIYLFPEPKHLVFNLVAVVVSGAAAIELSGFFSRKASGYGPTRLFVPLMGMLLPALALLENYGLVRPEASVFAIAMATSVILATQVFRRSSIEFELILPSVSANTTLLIYPGLFFAYIIRLSSLPDATFVILAFVCAVYFNDTMAYIAGRLLGRRSRGLLPISPNKSIPGFIGGFLISPAVVLAVHWLRPTLFPGSIWLRLLFGAIVGIVVIFGDLIESALKRSATMKDSGQIVPGRGGILDSVDSPIFAAPVFYYLYKVLFLS
jgi:phosphatidate cytidylyltransferase